jgi:hypothetical protein
VNQSFSVPFDKTGELQNLIFQTAQEVLEWLGVQGKPVELP